MMVAILREISATIGPYWTNGNKILHIKFKNNIYMKQFHFRFHFIFGAR